MNNLSDKTILITGAAKRVGKMFSLACAKAGFNIIIHHRHSPDEANQLQDEIRASFHASAWVLPCDLSLPDSVSQLIAQANEISPLYALVNSASIFENVSLQETTLESWEKHFAINLTAPFLLSQAFAKQVTHGRIINILDWRALRPQADHFPYTITKSALASMTKSLAIALAPNITVNGLALGAILPPTDLASDKNKIIESVPARRWAEAQEVEEALIFLLTCSTYITGEIIHLDGGRHLI